MLQCSKIKVSRISLIDISTKDKGLEIWDVRQSYAEYTVQCHNKHLQNSAVINFHKSNSNAWRFRGFLVVGLPSIHAFIGHWMHGKAQ